MIGILSGCLGFATVLELACGEIIRLKQPLVESEVNTEFISHNTGELSFFKFAPTMNATVSYSWYYDVVSTTPGDKSSFLLLNFLSNEQVPFTPFESSFHTTVTGSFANGTKWTVPLDAEEVTIVHDYLGTKSVSLDVGNQWGFSAFDLTESKPTYILYFHSAAHDLHGAVKMSAIAPPRTHCKLDCVGADQALIAGLGWANPIPDSIASVDLQISGESLSFRGSGYHDTLWFPDTKNWNYWYWGHARLGTYSLVWFFAQQPDGGFKYSAFLSESEKVLAISCEEHITHVRPWGKHAVYPPRFGSPSPEGVLVRFNLGAQGTFIANITSDVVVVDRDFSKFIRGSARGGFEGSRQYEGAGMFEIQQLVLPDEKAILDVGQSVLKHDCL